MTDPTAGPAQSAGRAGRWVGLGLLTGLGLALRLYALEDESLWGDEMNMVRFATGERPMELSFGNAPLYVALLRAVSVFGTSDFAYRLPAALFGAAIVPVVFLLGRRLADWRLGVVASVLAALSPTLLEHSQSVHSYSAFCLLSLLGHYLFSRAWERGSSLDWACLALIVGVGLYVHLYMVFVAANLVALSAVWAVQDGPAFGWRTLRVGYRRRRRPLLAAVVAIGAIWSPWLVRWIGPHLWDLARRSLGQTPRVDYLAQPPRQGAGFGLMARALQDLVSGDLKHRGLAATGVLLALVGAVALWRRCARQGAGTALWVALPLLPTAVFTYLSRIDYGSRRLVFLLPELLLLVAAGLLAVTGALVAGPTRGLGTGDRGRRLAALTLALLAAAAGSGRLASAYFAGERADYKRLAVLLAEQARRKDAVVAWKPELLGYYDRGRHELLDIEELTMEEVRRLHATSRRFWYIRPKAVRVSGRSGHPELEPWLEAEGALTFSFGGGLEVSFDRRVERLTERALRERVRLLEDALELKPDRWYLHQALARTYRGWTGKDAEARYHRQQAARLRP